MYEHFTQTLQLWTSLQTEKLMTHVEKLNLEKLTVSFSKFSFFKFWHLLIRYYQVPVLLICSLALSHSLKFKDSCTSTKRIFLSCLCNVYYVMVENVIKIRAHSELNVYFSFLTKSWFTTVATSEITIHEKKLQPLHISINALFN